MSRFGVLERLREQWLAAAGLALALIALALGLLPGGGDARVSVLALRHAIPAGGIRAACATWSRCRSRPPIARPSMLGVARRARRGAAR